MIFYHAGGEFFAMKGDADKFRKSLGLKPSDLHTLSISNREEICEFLNGLVQHRPIVPVPSNPDATFKLPAIEPEVVPDYVPRFLLNKEQQAARDAQ